MFHSSILASILICPKCKAPIQFSGDSLEKRLACEHGHTFSMMHNVADLSGVTAPKKVHRTAKLYGKLWETETVTPSRWHYHDMQAVIPKKMVIGKVGLEIGCGSGFDTYWMAKENPDVDFVSLDLSDGVYQARARTKNLKNVNIIKASATSIPIKDDTFDFAYSFGCSSIANCFLSFHFILKCFVRFPSLLKNKSATLVCRSKDSHFSLKICPLSG